MFAVEIGAPAACAAGARRFVAPVGRFWASVAQAGRDSPAYPNGPTAGIASEPARRRQCGSLPLWLSSPMESSARGLTITIRRRRHIPPATREETLCGSVLQP